MQPEQQQRIMGYFIEEAKEHLNTIEQGLLNLQSTLSDPEMTNELFRAAHSVKGGAAMLGLNSIQRVSHRLEDFFKVLKDSPVKVDQKLESLFLQVFDALQDLLGQLQSPFGLSEDTANATVAGVEPSFIELEQHLNSLAADRPAPAVTEAAGEPVAIPMAARQESALVLLFSNDIPVRLREMLQLFKQSETDPAVRQALQSICRNFISIGEQFELPDWCELVFLASRAIANSEHSYRTLAPVIIKDIKQAQELVLAGRSAEIYPCAQLQDLVPPPVALAQDDDFSDLQLTDAPEFVAAEPLDLATASTSEPVLEEFAFVEGLETAGSPSLEAFTSGFRGDRGDETDHNGPEVGIAELNSLADLFEGEVPDLGSTWQEEELLRESDEPLSDQIGDTFNADDSNDFSDLFAQPSSRPASTADANLNDLFEDALFEDAPLEDASALGLDDLAAFPPASNSSASDDLDGIFSLANSEPQADFSLDDLNSIATPRAPLEEVDLFGDLDLDSSLDLNSATPLDLPGADNELDFSGVPGANQSLDDMDEMDLDGFDLEALDGANQSSSQSNQMAGDRTSEVATSDDPFGFGTAELFSETEPTSGLDANSFDLFGSDPTFTDPAGLAPDLRSDSFSIADNASSNEAVESLDLDFANSEFASSGDLGDLLGELPGSDIEELMDSDDLDFSDLLGTGSPQPPVANEPVLDDDLVLDQLSDEADLDLSGDWLNEAVPEPPIVPSPFEAGLEDIPPAAVPDPWDTFVPSLEASDPAPDFAAASPAASDDLTADLWSSLDASATASSDETASAVSSADPFAAIAPDPGAIDFDLSELGAESGLEAIEELSLEDDFSFNFDNLGSTESQGAVGSEAIEELDLNQTFYQGTDPIEELSLTDDLSFDLEDLGLEGLELPAQPQLEAIEELSLTDSATGFDLDDLGLDALDLGQDSSTAESSLDALNLDPAGTEALFVDSVEETDFFLDGQEPALSEIPEPFDLGASLEADFPQGLVGDQLELPSLELPSLDRSSEPLTLSEAGFEAPVLVQDDSDDLDFLNAFSGEPSPEAGLEVPALALDDSDDLDFLNAFSGEPSLDLDAGAASIATDPTDDFLNFDEVLSATESAEPDLDAPELLLSEDSLDFGDDLFGADSDEGFSSATDSPADLTNSLFDDELEPTADDNLAMEALDFEADFLGLGELGATIVTPEALSEGNLNGDLSVDLNFEDDLFGPSEASLSNFPDSLELEGLDQLATLPELEMSGGAEIAESTPIEDEALDFGVYSLPGMEDLDTDVTLMNGLDQELFAGEPLSENSSAPELDTTDLFNFDDLDAPEALGEPLSSSFDSDRDLDDLDLDLDLFDPEGEQSDSAAALDSLSESTLTEGLSAADLDFQDDLFGTGELDADVPSGLDAASLDEMSLDEMDLFSEQEPAEIEATLGLEDNPDLAGLDQFLSTNTETSGEFGDLEAMLGSTADSNDDDSSGLDDFLSSDASGSESNLSEADFSDIDQLLGEDDSEPQGFGDLEDLLGPAALATAAIGAAGLAAHQFSKPADDFTDLDALLQGDIEPSPAGNVSAADLGFDELDDLLKDAEEKLPGSPTVKMGRGAAPQARRSVRPGRGFVEQTMRVPVKHLDNLSNLVGELVVNRNSLEEDQERLRQSLDNLLYQVQQLSDVGQRMQDLYERSLLESSLLASRQGSRSPAMSLFRDSQITTQTASTTGVEYDPLEMDRFTGFHSLSQEMIELIVRVRESSSDIEFIVDETDQVTRMFRQVTTQLQEGLTRSRMVPFAQTADRLPRAVRDISMQVGKQVELQIEGRETLIDKMILEQLYDPMTHLVNNALTHGIESPEVRRAAGKSAVGRITIRAFHQGNQTIISVTDDGAGIDVERVKAKAVEKGVLTPAEAKAMTRLDVYDLLFQAGFSTKDQADDFSGRGVGMDVVRTSLSEIRGVVNTDSTPGKGTSFTIRLPLTLSISKALCCISDRARVAFPMDGVEDMLDLPKERLQTNAEGKPCISWRDSMLTLYPLAELLGYNRHLSRGNVYGGNQEDDITSIVVLRSAGNFLALQVDQVLGEQEIVIKQLEGPIPKPVGVAGATVLGDGRIMPIADVLELIDLSMGRIRKDSGGSLWDQGAATPAEPQVVKTEPTVLIVDDSITVRELLSMTFNKVGYRVEQARDGQEAWEKLRSGLPCDIVFCDIEMPRMDGLELLSRIQKDPSLNHLPIAMLTSRGADRHRQMAASLGANGYFTKPYLEEALLDAAQRMLKGEVLLSPGPNP